MIMQQWKKRFEETHAEMKCILKWILVATKLRYSTGRYHNSPDRDAHAKRKLHNLFVLPRISTRQCSYILSINFQKNKFPKCYQTVLEFFSKIHRLPGSLWDFLQFWPYPARMLTKQNEISATSRKKSGKIRANAPMFRRKRRPWFLKHAHFKCWAALKLQFLHLSKTQKN